MESASAGCVLIRPGYSGEQEDLRGISARTTGAKALSMHLVTIPPGHRGTPHYHGGHESAIHVITGQAEIWHGEGLKESTIVRSGDFLYIAPGIPHLPVGHSQDMTITVAAWTDPDGQANAVAVELPGHLAHLAALPVAAEPGAAALPAGSGQAAAPPPPPADEPVSPARKEPQWASNR